MSKEFNTYIFKPNKGLESLEERKDLIAWIVLLLGVLFFLLEYYTPAIIIMFSIGILNLWILFTQTNRYPPLNGSFPFSLKITKDQITIGDKVFKTNDIEIERIICLDYKGRTTIEYAMFFEYAARSNGVNNHLWFISNNNEYRLRFRVDSEKHMRELEEIKIELGLGCEEKAPGSFFRKIF